MKGWFLRRPVAGSIQKLKMRLLSAQHSEDTMSTSDCAQSDRTRAMPRQSYYDEVEIEDFKWDPEKKVFHYPCPCGDRFEITKGQLRDGDDVATCPSCSLLLRVVYEWVS